MIALARLHAALLRVAILGQLQYRASGVIWMIGMIMEPMIYLVVWSTVTASRGGEVAGLDARGFAGYYLLYFVVNHFTFTWIMEVFQYRVEQGLLSFELLRPIHPIHGDVADNVAYKLVMLVVMLPAVVFLVVMFHPRIAFVSWTQCLAVLAVPLAFATRFAFEWTMGLAAFWTTRVNAINRTYFALFLFLSGRAAPVAVLPGPLRQLSEALPFYSMVGFPVELALGRLSPEQTLTGIAVQLAWVAGGAFLLSVLWRAALKRYSAVGA